MIFARRYEIGARSQPVDHIQRFQRNIPKLPQ
jgi:hypothetical protein